LERLGYHCYHMQEVPREPGHLDAWEQFVTGPATAVKIEGLRNLVI
jgi:hypothetical protein